MSFGPPPGLTQTSLCVALGHFGRSGQRVGQGLGQQSGQPVGTTVRTNLDKTTNKDDTGWQLTQGHSRIPAHWNPRHCFSTRRGKYVSGVAVAFLWTLCNVCVNRRLFCWDERLPKTRHRNVSPGQNCGPNGLKLAEPNVTPLSPCSLPIAAVWGNSGHKMFTDDLLSHQARISIHRKARRRRAQMQTKPRAGIPRRASNTKELSVELLPWTPRVGIFLGAGTVSESVG